jgi:hypothetical protein
MRVFQIEGGWGFDHLTLAERPAPKPGPRDVVVAMRMAALNARDLIVPERGYGRATGELPLIPVSLGVDADGLYPLLWRHDARREAAVAGMVMDPPSRDRRTRSRRCQARHAEIAGDGA